MVLLAWALNYPGRLISDTLDMLTQAQHLGTLYDWHAPVVTWLYSLFTPALGQPAGALLVQAMLLFFYPAVVSTVAEDRRLSFGGAVLGMATGACLVVLFVLTGQIVKDVVLVGAVLCLLATIDLRSGTTQGDGRWLAFQLALLALILAIRPTNFLMLVIAGGIYILFVFGAGRKSLLAALLLISACAASFPFATYVNRSVLGANNAHAEEALIIFDIAGISDDIKQNLFTELPGWPEGKLKQPWDCYTPRSWDPFKWGTDGCAQYADAFNVAAHQMGALSSMVKWWFGQILRHPVSYVKHRLLHIAVLFTYDTPITSWPYAANTKDHIDQINGAITHGIDTGGWTHGIDMSQKLQMWEPSIALVPFQWLAVRVLDGPFSLPLGLLVCVNILLWNWWNLRRGRGSDLVVIASSAIGVGNVAMLFAFGVSAEGRYMMVTLACAGVSLLRTIRAEVRSASPAPEQKLGTFA